MQHDNDDNTVTRYRAIVARRRLNTAAPDLLEAAKAMRRIDQTSTRADVNAACDLLDAAIAQAT
jgi:hypothetical protein